MKRGSRVVASRLISSRPRGFLLALLGVALLVIPLGCSTGQDTLATVSATSSSASGELDGFAPNSPTAVRDAALAAIDKLGPTKVVVRWRHREDGSGESEATQELWFDQANHRARQAADQPDFKLASVDGRESVSVGVRPGQIEVERRLRLEPPQGLPLPIAPDYVALLSKNEPKRVHQVGDDLELVLERDVEEILEGAKGSSIITILLGPDLLPQRVARDTLLIVGEGQREFHDVLEYEFTAIPPLSAEDVRIDEAYRQSHVAAFVELPVEHPFHETALWSQYWFGPEVLGLPVAKAEWRGFGDDPEASDQSIVLRYAASPPPDEGEAYIELRTSPANEQERQVMKDRKSRPLERQIAGEPAQIALTRAPEEGQGVLGAQVLLPDTFLSLWIEGGAVLAEEDVLELLDGLQPLQGPS